MINRTIKHEIKLQKSVIIILGVLAVGVFANAFAPTFGIKEAFADGHTWTREISKSVNLVASSVDMVANAVSYIDCSR